MKQRSRSQLWGPKTWFGAYLGQTHSFTEEIFPEHLLCARLCRGQGDEVFKEPPGSGPQGQS